MKTANFPLPNI